MMSRCLWSFLVAFLFCGGAKADLIIKGDVEELEVTDPVTVESEPLKVDGRPSFDPDGSRGVKVSAGGRRSIGNAVRANTNTLSAPVVVPAGAVRINAVPTPTPAPIAESFSAGSASTQSIARPDVVVVPQVIFTMHGGDTIRETLERWCKSIGWTMRWKVRYEVAVEDSYTFAPGTTLKESVTEVMKALWHSQGALTASFYGQQKLLVVQAKE